MSHNLTLGSLFDGSGGFPLAGSLCGITPKWCSEIEPYPIAVTCSRFPDMKHYGDVSKINGAEVEPVDIITFGSPCQDLSVAGKRAGLRHESNGDEETTRSGLFMEAVRIIKEMRDATNGVYPRFALWENVPGAFSSNKGEDFRVVIEELIKVVEPTCKVPPAPKGGWPYADAYMGPGWSLAYRVFDAQHWGVPQRRRRIYLVADFTGECAADVLFEREGLRGYFAEGGTPWQGAASDAERSPGADDREGNCLTPWDYQSKRVFALDGAMATLPSGERSGQNQQSVFVPIAFAQNQRDEVRDLHGKAGALAAEPGMKQQTFVAVPDLLLDDQGGSQISVRTDGKVPTLRAEAHGNVPCVVEAGGFKELNSAKARSDGFGYEKAPCLAANKHDACVCYSIENHPADSRVNIDETGKVQCLTSRMGTGGGNVPMVMEVFRKGTRPHSKDEAQVWESAKVANTLNTFDQGEARANELVIEARTFAMQAFGQYKETDVASAIKARDFKDATDLVCGVDCRNMNEYPELYPTLQAKPNGGQSLNFSGAVRVRYIVRRLTPTECARLQGFADRWGDIDPKEDFTDEEYRFWLDVRNTHATINGKTVKEHTKAQMLTWYNKLHTDSAEYKMWGNGIALPPALYVMQGITDVFCGGK